jgi:hypothetical protein
MVKWIPLSIAILIAAATIRAIVVGAASANGDDITKRDSPIAYWTIVVAAILAVLLLLWEALRDSVT